MSDRFYFFSRINGDPYVTIETENSYVQIKLTEDEWDRFNK